MSSGFFRRNKDDNRRVEEVKREPEVAQRKGHSAATHGNDDEDHSPPRYLLVRRRGERETACMAAKSCDAGPRPKRGDLGPALGILTAYTLMTMACSVSHLLLPPSNFDPVIPHLATGLTHTSSYLPMILYSLFFRGAPSEHHRSFRRLCVAHAYWGLSRPQESC
ncbi:hypothetical protein EDB92DRAFT_1870472 [Lactarius akahatsu]|uniref:Uncharacterized protein n=1 Tax=Lactarius akahatsu TaxID=416441 RepID=A0AAD4LEP6_9AGAM|nr:hypothetical protein EDB92DRAFT_1870472 [Lactarius akahatsu]